MIGKCYQFPMQWNPPQKDFYVVCLHLGHTLTQAAGAHLC